MSDGTTTRDPYQPRAVGCQSNRIDNQSRRPDPEFLEHKRMHRPFLLFCPCFDSGYGTYSSTGDARTFSDGLCESETPSVFL
jgi:hypothetical protein